MIFDDLDDGEEPWLPPCPEPEGFAHLAPPTCHRPEWWRTTDAESHLADYPEFDSAAHRGRWMVEQMARGALEALNASENDPVLERGDGTPVSLSELLAGMDELELGTNFGAPSDESSYRSRKSPM